METNSQVLIPERKQKQKNNFPIIDFSEENLKPGTSCWLLSCKAVRDALEEYGCFFAVYDVVSSEIKNKLLLSLKDLFDLPLETKMKNINLDMPYFGYIKPMADAQLFEGFGFIDATKMEAVQGFADLMLPSKNEHFCETLYWYAKKASELEQRITRMVFEGYGVAKYMDSRIKSTTYLLRAGGYKSPRENGTNNYVGAIAHTDPSFISMLQENEVPGLEVQAKDGTWMPVHFPPSSFMVMAGDAAMAWGHGRINSCIHRVMITGKESRYSIGIFSYDRGIFHVPEELADDENPLQFKSFDHFGLLRFTAQTLDLTARERVKSYCNALDAV